MVKFLGKMGAFTKTGKPRERRSAPEEDDEENKEEEGRWWERMEGDREADYGMLEGETSGEVGTVQVDRERPRGEQETI